MKLTRSEKHLLLKALKHYDDYKKSIHPRVRGVGRIGETIDIQSLEKKIEGCKVEEVTV